jgi:hypothetical protein
MSPNQLHGKRFEDFIKSCGLFPGSADAARSPTSPFDIEARFDRVCGLPTSIKTTGSNVVTLADARRFFATPAPYRMLVGRYRQVGDRKEFCEVHEFMLTDRALDDLKGELSLGDVAAFHEGLHISRFPLGMHQDARRWSRDRQRQLRSRASRIVLNPKIDSGTQRRLQCSLRLTSLVEAASHWGEYMLHTEQIGSVILPIVQASPRRTFKPRPA